MLYTNEELELINKYNELQDRKNNELKVKNELEQDKIRKEIFKKKRDEIIMHLANTCKSISEIDETLAIYKETLQNKLDNNRKFIEKRLEDFGEYKGVCVHDYPTYTSSLTDNFNFRHCGICGARNPQFYYNDGY